MLGDTHQILSIVKMVEIVCCFVYYSLWPPSGSRAG